MKCNYKTLTRRDQNEELVLLLFRCNDCHKNSAYWEDGVPYEVNHDNESGNCEIPTKSNPPKKKTSKKHDIKDIDDPYYWDIDLEHDPDYAKDYYKFCFYDEH